MRLIVSIPTTNRPSVIGPTVCDITRQSRLPDLVLIVVAAASDVVRKNLSDLPFEIEVLRSERGLAHQRNRALRVLREDDILLFLDDDFIMSPDYLKNLEQLFRTHTDIAMATGQVIADGIHGKGFSHAYGKQLTGSSYQEDQHEGREPQTVYNGYGCNMAIRASCVISNDLAFDENLKLYAWLEDVDFSRQMAKHGRIVKSTALQGVHLGTKSGRSSGRRLGYSQIANPIYLMRKGTMIPSRAANILLRNLAANAVRSLKPEPEVDRLGRLTGNLKAFKDLLRGRLHPSRILTFE